jgi:hypothetical protein
MTEPKDISVFKDQLLASEEISSLALSEWGMEANEKWAAFERGEALDNLYMLLLDAKCGPFCENLGGPAAAAPDNDVFYIQVARIGPVFFITACEFDDIGYFASKAEADEYARDYFSSWIRALEERQASRD